MAIQSEVDEVWAKGQAMPHNDPNVWRKDECGAWINRSKYGDRDSDYGWEIDHITSIAHGGADILSNKRPLQWQNNLNKGQGRLVCKVRSDGPKNVPA